MNDSATPSIVRHARALGGPPAATNPSALPAVHVLVLQVHGGDREHHGSCATNQNIIFDVLEGNLTQLAFITGANTDATIVDLGAITVPFVDTVLSGDLNTIQVADNRGGQFGWNLSAVMTDFDAGTYTVAAGQLDATPTCGDATDIYDYANYTNPNALPPVLGHG